MPNAWFRMYAEFADDPKVQMMSEAMQRRLAMLFCDHCKEERLTDTQRAFKWRISMQDLAETKALFLENWFIDEDWMLANWYKRQYLASTGADGIALRRRGYVYYVADSSQIKIGFSSNPWARLSELRVAIPGAELLAVESGDQGLEHKRHEQFAAIRVNREWFKKDNILTAFVATLRNGSVVATTDTEQNRTEQTQKKTSTAASAVVEEKVVFDLPLADKSVYGVPEYLFNEYKIAYPGVIVMSEFSKMRTWLISNPRNMKTRSGMPKFMNSWLSRAQNSAPIRKGGNSNAPLLNGKGDHNLELYQNFDREEEYRGGALEDGNLPVYEGRPDDIRVIRGGS